MGVKAGSLMKKRLRLHLAWSPHDKCRQRQSRFADEEAIETAEVELEATAREPVKAGSLMKKRLRQPNDRDDELVHNRSSKPVR